MESKSFYQFEGVSFKWTVGIYLKWIQGVSFKWTRGGNGDWIFHSATHAGQDLRAKDIDRMHKQRGFNQIGYNFVIDLDGTVENGRPLSVDGAHCNTKGDSGRSYNKHSIGICYIGGLDVNGKAADTRTEAQRIALRDLVEKLCRDYPIIEVLGHRDTSPDLNDNGEVEPFEYIKACPCFDVRKEFSNFMKPVIIRP